MKLGLKVRQAIPIIEGDVVDVEWDKDRDQKRIKVEWSDGDDVVARWFLESDLEVIDGQ